MDDNTYYNQTRLNDQLTKASIEELLRQDEDIVKKLESTVAWFHGKISRETAENIHRQGQMLFVSSKQTAEKHGSWDHDGIPSELHQQACITDHGNINGLFLVRESTTTSNDFVLSLMFERRPYHFHIQNKCEGHYHIDRGPVIHGLDELIFRYIENDHGLPHKLSQFCIGKPPPHQSRKFGCTNILHRAVSEGKVETVRQILDSTRCPDINMKNRDGSTALHDASFYGHSEIVSVLLEKGALANSRDSGGYTALARACCGGSGQPTAVATLINKGGADPQEPCPSTGWVPLHEAAMRGYAECVKMLLAFDAPLMSRTDDGETPQDIAKKYGKTECVNVLSKYKVPKPQLRKEQWYHDIDRQGAARLFSQYGVQDGLFLIRPSSRDPDWHVLSLCFNKSPYNYEIRPSKYLGKSVYYIDDGPFMESLEHVVYHYSHRSDGLPCRLKKALSPNGQIVEVSIIAPSEEDNEYCNYKNLDAPGLPPRPEDLHAGAMASTVNNRSVPPPLPSYPPPTKKKEEDLIKFTKEKIKLGNILGEGEYGSVFKGILTEDNKKKRDVAIKCFHEDHVNVRADFFQEAKTMQSLDHPCIVKLLGVSEGPPLMMVQEFIPKGSMLDFLLDYPEKVKVKVDLYLWASQIAAGMMYLEDKHLVHRDLAARNILLQSKLQAKISDFGLSRAIGSESDYYRASRGGRWPIKWYAPECVNYGQFSHASDVWSYGVSLWEMFTFGEPPYGDKKGAEVIKDIENGKRLYKPERCEDVVYELMLSCWAARPADRPTFAKLHYNFESHDEYQSIKMLMDKARQL